VLRDTPAPPPSPSPAAPTSPLKPAASSATAPAAPAASLIGEWDFRAEADSGVIAGTLRFRLVPEGLAGAYIGLRGNATQLSNLSTAGNRVSFDLVSPTAVWHLEGTVSGDSIAGTFQTAERTVRWTALRKAPSEPAPSATRRPSQ
jgi:hypothetical protein